ncbi:MAG: hypothetical protein ABR538_02535 [Candidatus Binatia bacterium]
MSGSTNAGGVSTKVAALAAAFLFLTAVAAPASAQLTVTPITWDVVGLDHNRPLTSGPELFPAGARVCSATATTNVEVDFVWTDGNGSGWDFGPGHPYINLRSGSLTSLDFAAIGAGECVDAYFELRVTRSALAFGQTREYSIVATDGNGSASSPQPRQILVEQLVSQNRNTTTQIRYGQQVDESDWLTLGYGGSINLAIGNTYFLELTTQTSTSYEELQSFLTLSNTIFQVLGVSTTYGVLTAPPSRVPVPNPGLWADGCLWDSDPESPNYSSCLSTGKAGGVVVTTYEIRIISGGGDSVSLNAMIYDRSGSSFHYNTDFSTPQGDLVTYDPAGSLIAKRFVPDTIGLGGTSRLRFTITNPNPVAISGYNFLDELPAGMLVAAPANATTTCGGTVTAVSGTDEIALAGGFVGAGGSCTVLVDVTAAGAGTYNNVSQNLFIGDADTGNNASATLTVSATAPPVLSCDENATLALWQFPLAANALAPAPTSNLVTASAAAGPGLTLTATIDPTNNDVGGSWETDNINVGALNTANQEYFEFTIDTTGLDSITLDFASRRTTQGAQAAQLYYGPAAENASTVYSLPAAATWYANGPTTLSSGLNPTGNTVFRIYVYSAGQSNNGHSIFLDGVRFRGLYCQEVPPPPPTPGVNPPTIAKIFSPTPIGVGHETTLTFTIANPNPATALSGISFVDELPFGMSVVPGTFGGTCTGFWSTDPGDSGVLLHSGGSLAASGSCNLTVDVTSSTVGTALNISDPIYATESGYNNNLSTGIAQASLLVLASPLIAKEFVPNLLLLGVTPNDASTLTFTVTNPNPDDAIGGVSFSDSLPAGLEVASPPNAATSGCGAPTWAPTAGATSLSFSGGSIAAGDACTVTVDVTGPIGLYDNVSSAVTHIVSGEPATNGEVAEASLQIDEPIPGVAVQKLAGPGSDPDLDPWSDYVAVLPGQDVFYKIVVENTGEVPLTGLVVSDPDVDTSGCVWPNPLPVADVFDNHIATCIVGPVAAIAGTHDNTATAEANSSAGPVDDSDSATYATVVLSFSKVADPLVYTTAGDVIDYTFTLTNSGAAILAGPVTLIDPLVPGATCESLATVGNLDAFFDPGESVECSGSYSILPADVTNGSVTNTAYASVGGFDSPTDSATVNTNACAPGACCVAGSYLVAGTTCRAASGVCDTPETCTGTSSDCPADAFEPASTVCRAASGVCDVAENCTGAAAACPADAFAASTVECRASGGVCDVAENCTGAGAACPADAFAASTVECRASGGVCDLAENCTGAGAACPADAFAASTVECRASGGVCDLAGNCTGAGAACPADAFAAFGLPCGSSNDTLCDNPDSCDGAGACAPNNEPTTVECRPDAGECDVPENCDGAGSCPADMFAPVLTACGDPSDTDCDNPDTCDGAGMCLANADPGNPMCLLAADLAITITDLTGPVQAGAFTTYQVDVSNLGPDDASDTVATIVLDPNTTFVATNGPCVEGPVGTLVCTLGTVGAGSITSFEIVVHVNPAAPTAGTDTGPACPGGQDLCAPATVTSSTPDSNPANNASEVASDVIVATTFAEIELAKTDLTAEPVAPGDNVVYQIVVANNGTDTATDVVVYESLDPYMTYVSDTAPLGCTLHSNALGDQLVCALGDIVNGDSVTFEVEVTIAMGAPIGSPLQDGACSGAEDVCNEAVVTTSASDAIILNNNDSEPTDVSPAQFCGNGNLDPGEECDPPSGEVCNNGIDDDGDMLIDCADPNCTLPGFQSCNGACELTPPCVPILDDPARLTWNYVKLHGRFIPTTDANPLLDGFVFLVSNADGEVFRATLLAGDLKHVGGTGLKRWAFKDKLAKTSEAVRGGISRVYVKQRREQDGQISYPFKIKAYGDMTKALQSRMTTQVYLSDDVGFLTATWEGKPGRWRLTLKQARAGLEQE